MALWSNTACFCKQSLIGIQPHPFVYILPVLLLGTVEELSSYDRDCMVCKA